MTSAEFQWFSPVQFLCLLLAGWINREQLQVIEYLQTEGAVLRELLGKKYILMDRDTKYCAEFREILRGCGVKPLRLPARSPNLNAYAERFVRSIKEECLNRADLLRRENAAACCHTILRPLSSRAQPSRT